MGSDEIKTPRELEAFLRFIEAEGYPIDPESIQKLRGESQPDFSCRTFAGEHFAFEVTALSDTAVAKMIARAPKESAGAIWPGDPTARILRNKMQKTYQTDLPVELLCYWDARTVSTDDMIIATIEEIASGVSNPFRRVWYLGEEGVYLLCGDARHPTRHFANWT